MVKTKFFVLLLISVVKSEPNLCGQSLNEQNWRIINGEDARDGEFPWHVMVGHKWSDTMLEYMCGGSLISDQWVVTAAHCLLQMDWTLDAKHVAVVLGAYNFSKIAELQYQTGINKTVIHPLYTNWTSYQYGHDIALLKLNDRLDFEGKDSHLRPICLNKKDTHLTDNCLAIGFGRTATADYSNILQKVDQVVHSDQDCEKSFPGNYYKDMEVCVGDDRKGKPRSGCTGDSGGPFLCKGTDAKWYQVGITSFGACAEKEHTNSVYTKVSSYVDWIAEVIRE